MFKTVNNGKLPTRGSKYSACVDVYANETVVVGAGETVMIGLGVVIDEDELKKMIYETYFNNAYGKPRVESVGISYYSEHFLSSHYLQLMPRSNLRAKGLISNVGIIDLDYMPHCNIKESVKNGHCKGFKQKNKA